MVKRRRTIRTVLFGGLGVAAGIAIVGVTAAQSRPQPGRHTVSIKNPPTCEQAKQETGRQGSQVACVEPPTAVPGAAVTRHGPYQIIPAGFTGDLTTNQLSLPANLGERTSDLAALRRSSLYAEPSYLPAGYQLIRGDTFDGTSELLVHLTYEKPPGGLSWQIEIYRQRQTQEFINVRAPLPTGDIALQQTTIRGATAIILAPKPGTLAEKIGMVEVLFVRNGVNTMVRAHNLSVQEVTRVAESIP